MASIYLSFAICYYLLVLSIVVMSLYFVYYLTRYCVNDNVCFYLHHSTVLVVVNVLQLIYTSFIQFDLSELVKDPPLYPIEDPEILMAQWIWAGSVYLVLCQQFSFVTAAASKVVSLTFKRHHHSEVWSVKVLVFVNFVLLAFPLIFVMSFGFDQPRIVKIGSILIWQNNALYKDYLRMLHAVCWFSSFLAMGGLLGGIFKRCYLGWNNTNSAVWGQPPIVHMAGGDGNPTDDARRPVSVAATFHSRETHYALILFLYGIPLTLQTTFFRQGYPSATVRDLAFNLMVVLSYPSMMIFYWTLPSIVRLIKYSRLCLGRSSSSSNAPSALYTVTTSNGQIQFDAVRRDTISGIT